MPRSGAAIVAPDYGETAKLRRFNEAGAIMPRSGGLR